jgi:hypothetical protein
MAVALYGIELICHHTFDCRWTSQESSATHRVAFEVFFEQQVARNGQATPKEVRIPLSRGNRLAAATRHDGCHGTSPVVPSQPSRRLGPGNRHVPETLSPGSVSAIMSFPGRPQVSALCRCWRSWRRRLGGRPAGQRVDLLPLLPRRDRPVATRAAGPASEGSPCNCIGNAGRTVRGGGALPAAQLRCLGVTHEMLVAPAEQVWDDPVFRSHRD